MTLLVSPQDVLTPEAFAVIGSSAQKEHASMKGGLSPALKAAKALSVQLSAASSRTSDAMLSGIRMWHRAWTMARVKEDYKQLSDASHCMCLSVCLVEGHAMSRADTAILSGSGSTKAQLVGKQAGMTT